jgi:hypothetical protein
MKRFPIIGILLLIPALMLTVMVGCNKEPAKNTEDKTKDPKKAGEAKEITSATEGVVKGVVKFKGGANPEKPEARIAEHKEKDLCMAGGGKNILDQLWLVKEGVVENVVISLEPPEGKKYKIDKKLKDAFEKKEAIIDQPYCAYVPHIVALYAGVQPFVVQNSAKFLHNTKIDGGVKNGKTDDPVPPKVGDKPGRLKPRTFVKDSNPIPVQCSLHNWMNAKIITFDHPYFAVTNEKGEFTIENVPIDEELVVYMWHDSMDNKKEFKKLSFKKGDNTIEGMELSK